MNSTLLGKEQVFVVSKIQRLEMSFAAHFSPRHVITKRMCSGAGREVIFTNNWSGGQRGVEN